MVSSHSRSYLFLRQLYTHTDGQQRRINPIEWVPIADSLGFSEVDKREAINRLKAEGLIESKPPTEALALTFKGIDEAEKTMESQKPRRVDDPLPKTRTEVREELDYWAQHLHDGQPGSDHWIAVESRLTNLRHLEQTMPTGKSNDLTHAAPIVFISHSSNDAALAEALIDLLKSALGLVASQIRCSSVDGYRLPVGVNTESKLRDEVNTTRVVIGLITPNSLLSYYVMFELGARWGANLFLAPLLAGVKPGELSGPLSLLNALSANSEAQIHQLLHDVGVQLNVTLQNAASYVRYVAQIKHLADSIVPGVPGKAVAPTPARQNLTISLTAEGVPPNQVIKVQANQPVKVSRLEYMLSNETCIVGEDVTLEGETVLAPLNHDSLTKLWNTPRSDRNYSDHSGPAKISITVSFDGKTQPFVLPVNMEDFYKDSTSYRKLVGSKTVYGA